ncbi:MAG: VWA domain-containing protein [Planctomycetes bacterium]|nr:VWA domain-containing protein [Planctomycetota bacterium]
MNSGSFIFAQPWALAWLWLVAVVVLVAFLGLRKRRALLLRIASWPLVQQLIPNLNLARGWFRAALGVLGMVAVTLALMDPRWGMQVEQIQQRGLDVAFIIDVSRSMLAADATPNRLERAKQFAIDASEVLGGDRVALIDCAGVPSLRVPLTLNYAAFRQAVTELEPKGVTRGGSLLGDAIRLAARSFPAESKGARAIIILSDGEDMESMPVDAARQAFTESGIRIFTVGIGDSRDGARIPVAESGKATRWQMHDGQEVWTKMDETTMREIAAAGGGAFIPAGTAQLDMAKVYQDSIGNLERVEQEETVIRRQTPRFQWFAGAALLILLVESLVTDTRGKGQSRGTPS